MKLIKNMMYNTVYQVLILILPLITAPYVSRTLGTTGVGIYSSTAAWLGYFVLAGGLGITLYGNREIAYHQKDKEARSRIFYELLSLKFITVAVALIAYLIFIFFQNKWEIYFLLQGITLIAVAFDVSWFFMGLENFKVIVVRNTIIRLLLTVAIFVFVRTPNDLWLYILLLALSTLIGNMTVWPFLRREIMRIPVRSLNIFQHLRPVIMLLLPQVSITIYTSLNKNLLQIFSGLDSVAYFTQTYMIIILGATLVSSFNSAFLPHLSGLFSSGESEKVKPLILKSIDLGNCISILCISGIIGVSQTFAVFYFGKNFAPVGSLLAVGSITIFFLALTNALSTQYLLAAKKMHEYMMSTIVGLIVNVLFNLILIPVLGTMGAIIATILTEVSVATYILLKLRNLFTLKEVFHGLWKYIIGGALVFVFLDFVNNNFPISILNYLIQTIIAVLIYIVTLYVLRAPANSLVSPYIKKIIKR
ncbi:MULTISPECIES: oligosaccharide flippase family protein [Lactococcus]|uniref:oligosaccharide flippase family protein n=1 Tax=Lactococcus TaxID=1357 RepID=UPI001CDC37D2|nr:MULTISPECIES: oligosaccharide flippase family protein [Lactococcus]MCA2390898.1 oligosaccharide flippase family protein [Lactococcus sp. NH2-7C]MCT1182801.1 flippase [Lactococcus lactis]MCT1193275.1 flippase [Lactococcus lactis]WGV29552.1 oligosaccharide flippase family protein [Lactococcus sp. NH2-7C]